VVFTDPMTSSGKVMRRKLSEIDAAATTAR
jgi:acyl-coenzyme A synthetase/AMP-(fatty) acid ligase